MSTEGSRHEAREGRRVALGPARQNEGVPRAAGNGDGLGNAHRKKQCADCSAHFSFGKLVYLIPQCECTL